METTPWADYALRVRKAAGGNEDFWKGLKRRVNAMVKIGVSGRNRMSFAPGVPERLLEVTETFGRGWRWAEEREA